MKLRTVIAAAMLAATATAADASVSTFHLTVTASDFQGDGFPSPPDPVVVDVTVTFDPALDIPPTTTGLIVHSNTLTYSTEFSFIDNILFLGTHLAADGGCYSDTETYCVGVTGITTTTPSIYGGGLNIIDQYDQFWQSANTSVTVDLGATPAPEPVSWILALLGFGAVAAGRAFQVSRKLRKVSMRALIAARP